MPQTKPTVSPPTLPENPSTWEGRRLGPRGSLTLRNKLTGGGISVSDVFSEKGHKGRSDSIGKAIRPKRVYRRLLLVPASPGHRAAYLEEPLPPARF